MLVVVHHAEGDRRIIPTGRVNHCRSWIKPDEIAISSGMHNTDGSSVAAAIVEDAVRLRHPAAQLFEVHGMCEGFGGSDVIPIVDLQIKFSLGFHPVIFAEP